MTASITRTAVDTELGMTTSEVYDFLVALSTAGIFHPAPLVARTGPAGQLLSLTHPQPPPTNPRNSRTGRE